MSKKLLIIIGMLFFVVIGAIAFWYIQNNDSNCTTPIALQNQGSIELLPVESAEESFSIPYLVVEATLEVDSQTIIVYYPAELPEGSPLIVYSHGSNEHVSPEIVPAGFADALPRYGEYFAQQGAFFVTSEMYGENWGSSQSQLHLLELVSYFKETYAVGEVYMFGFSMGGLPALRTAKRYPEVIDKVALLAPTIAMEDWTSTTLTDIEAIPVHIWHGTEDVNVPIDLSRELFTRATNMGFTNIVLEEIPGETHRHFVESEVLWAFFTKL